MSAFDKDNFFKACRKGNLEYLEKVLKEDKILEQPGITVYNILNNYGWSPLYMATEYGKIEVIKLLLNYGFDVNFGGYGVRSLDVIIITNKEVASPLEVACIHTNTKKSYKIVKLLLEKGANPNHRSLYSPLIQTARSIFCDVDLNTNSCLSWNYQEALKKTKVFKLLLDYGANPDLKFGKKESIYDFIPDEEECESYETEQEDDELLLYYEIGEMIWSLIKKSKRRSFVKPAKKE